MSTMASVASIKEAAASVRERIAQAGGDPDRVRVVAVTKAFGPEIVGRALDAGLLDLGENYAQELQARLSWLDAEPTRRPAPRWHFIGGLQRNKVKLLAGRIHLWQSVDRAALIDEIAKRSAGDAVLIQVNTTAEPQKAGCLPTEARALVDRGRERGLDVRGLMTVGPTGGGDPRPSFERLRCLAEICEVEELSMGMSDDFEVAVAEGSTMIRVGSVLFGDRPQR